MTALLVAMLLSQEASEVPPAPADLTQLTSVQLLDEWQRLDDATPRIGGEIGGIVGGGAGFFFGSFGVAIAINDRFRRRFPFEGPPDDSLLGFTLAFTLASAACVLISTWLLTRFLPERHELEAEANRVRARLIEIGEFQPQPHALDRL